MGKYREDDLDLYIMQLEKQKNSQQRKPEQRWEGEAVVQLEDREGPPSCVSPRWMIRPVERVDGVWARLVVVYRARGANADDVVRKLSFLTGRDPSEIKVATKNVYQLEEI